MAVLVILAQVSEVTRILNAAQQGDPTAADQLLPLVYEELRRLAAHRMANEAAGHTLQPTALVHEAWLRLAGGEAYLPILEILDSLLHGHSLLHGQSGGRFTDMMKTLSPTWYVHVGMLSMESISAQQLREETKIT